MPELAQNPPYKRFRYIAKLYGDKHPEVVLDTFWVLADTIGIENPASRFDFAKTWRYVADPVVGRYDLRRAMMAHGVGQSASVAATELRHPVVAADVLNSAMEELAEAPEMKRGRESDALWPWVARELVLAKKEALSQEVAPGVWGPPIDVWPYLLALNVLQDKGSALALWQRQERIDLGKWHLYDVMVALEGFEVSRRGVSQGEVLYRWPDGWTMQKLVSQEQLDAEGEVMQHCVGTYCEVLYEGPVDILSLRDPSGNPHVTIEYNEEINRFVQVQGKQNNRPLPAYMKRVEEFAKWKGVQSADTLSEKEREAIVHYAEERAGREWDELVERGGFSLAGAEYWPGTVDYYDILNTEAPFSEHPDVYSEMDDVLTDFAHEAISDAWASIYNEAIRAFEEAIEEAVSAAEEEDEPELGDLVRDALNGMDWNWGAEDYESALEEVKFRLA